MAQQALSKRTGQIEVLPPEKPSERLTLAKETAVAIAAFMKNAVAFFDTAEAIEKKANATLAAANALKKPTDKASDEIVQRIAVRASQEIKAAQLHWKPITSTLDGWHKWFVSRRQRPVGVLERAAKIANDFHNEYAEDDARRVAAEAERRRVEAERKAADDKRRELDALEAKALEAEAATEDLSPRETKFVEFIVDGHYSTRAATQAAGYKDLERGAALLEMKKIKKAIEGLRDARAMREQAAAIVEQPIAVEVPAVESQLGEAAGSRTTWTGELLDEPALVRAIVKGVIVAYLQLGDGITDATMDGAVDMAMQTCAIPVDMLRIHEPALNVHAKALGVEINRWPGARAKKSTKAVGR